MEEKTLRAIKSDMEIYDEAAPELKALLREFSMDDIVKCGTAIGTNDFEVIGRVLYIGRQRLEQKKMEVGRLAKENRLRRAA